jgi:long-chain acyl-CoA synthetase
MIAARLGAPVIPVRLEGLDRILHQKARFPTRGKARVAFGRPINLRGTDYAALALEIEMAVKQL